MEKGLEGDDKVREEMRQAILMALRDQYQKYLDAGSPPDYDMESARSEFSNLLHSLAIPPAGALATEDQ